MAGMAAIASPGEFRIKDTDPEAIAASFDRYIRRMEAFFVVSRSRGRNGGLIDFDSDTKKSLLLTVGGDEMIKLYDHVGGVQAGDNYDTTIEKIRTDGVPQSWSDTAQMQEMYTLEQKVLP